ncbi:MAG: hypothetical protein GY953_23620 [bacterium]|nr:hypothetical protein [bacterium]
MWRTALISIAAVSLLAAAERPRYGGVLRVKANAAGASDRLIYETLVTLDPQGQPQPSLAISWKRNADATRWEFRLRPVVRLHDGSLLEAAAIADAWQPFVEDFAVRAKPDSLIIECVRPMPELPALLAEDRFAVKLPFSPATLIGTGPFQLAESAPGESLLLLAHEEHWAGRPFLDGIRFEFGLPVSQRMLALDAGQADVVEVPPHQVSRAAEERRHLAVSKPVEQVALVFNQQTSIARNPQLRQAVALAVRREPVHRILLNEHGTPTGALLPDWLSGYAFVFPRTADLAEARRLVTSLSAPARRLRLSRDRDDPFASLLADRMALDLRDAGFQVRTTEERAELQLMRVRISSTDPHRALANLAAEFGITWLPKLDHPPPTGMLYEAEAFLLEGHWVIPLFHLPVTFTLGPRVRNWGPLDNVWLAAQERAP